MPGFRLTTLILVVGLATALPAPARADILVDFEDKSLAANSFYNGSDLAGGFSSRGASFNNKYSTQFSSWDGWAYSNVNAPNVGGFTNQYASITGTGFGGSGNYGVAYDDGPNASFINLPAGASPLSMEVTNTAYAYFSMLNGDPFAKKFAAGDFLTMKVSGYTGLNATGTKLGEKDFDLARYVTNADHPVNVWSFVNLAPVGAARSLGFDMASSDVGVFGINTPTYFAIDNLTLASAVPEPSSFVLIAVGLGALVLEARRLGTRNSRD